MTNGVGQQPAGKPIPDPTVLTTEQLLREVDRAITLLQAEARGDRDKNDVRFDGIASHFITAEEWRREQKLDTRTAVDAALNAAKEAVKQQTDTSEKAIAKSESSTAAQSQQQNVTFTANFKGLTDSLADVKERVVKIENIKLGMTERQNTQRQDRNDSQYLVFGVVGIFLTMAALGIPLVIALTR